MCLNRSRTFLALTLVVVATGLALTQCPTAEADERPGRKLALLVGVKEYDHSLLTQLQFPENDVEELAEILRAQQFQVVLLTTAVGNANPRLNPTAENIQRELTTLLKRVGRRDLIVLGLAGHGIQPLGSDRAYFCPFDGNPTTKAGKEKDAPNVAAFPETLISIDETLETIGNSGIGQTVLLVDACRNDPGVRGRRGVDRVRVQALPAETVVLLSCSPGQFAFEHKSWGKGGHGAFFSQVIEGLRGAAADETGRVTWDDLARHLRKRVPVLVKDAYGKDGGVQRPNIIANFSADPVSLATVSPRRQPLAEAPPSPTPSPESSPANPNLKKLRLSPTSDFNLMTIFGKGPASPELVALRKVMKREPEVSKYSDCSFSTWKQDGLSIRFDNKEIVSTIFLYSSKDDSINKGYGKFAGELPGGIQFSDTRRDIERKFGQPQSAGTSWSSYPEAGFGVTYVVIKDSKSASDAICYLSIKAPKPLNTTIPPAGTPGGGAKK